MGNQNNQNQSPGQQSQNPSQKPGQQQGCGQKPGRADIEVPDLIFVS